MEKEPQIPTPPPNSDPDEIDLLALAKTLWKGRRIVLKSIFICGFIGIVIALSTPNEFTSKAVLVPQLGGEKGSGLSGLAALAGINMGMNSSSTDLSPVIYPRILSSVPFQLELMNTPLQFSGYPTPISYYEYINTKKSFSPLGLIVKYTVGLPSLLLNALKREKKDTLVFGNDQKIIHLTQKQRAAINALNNLTTLEVNSKEGYLTLTCTLQEPLPSAQLTQKTLDLLQQYIIEFKIKKVKADLDFIQGRFNEKKTEFEQAQENLAIRIDRDKNFTSGLSSIGTDRLQTKYTLTFGVYQELAKQLEQTKIQVKKDTPVFAIIQPVIIPSEKSGPNRRITLMIWIFLGGIIGTGIVFGKNFIELIKKKWKED